MKELGAGGFGKVYRSIHPLTGKPCALKFMPADVLTLMPVRKEFDLMCRFGAECCNVMAPQYLQLNDKEACLAMDCCRGTLDSFVEASHVARNTVLNEAMVLALGVQMARGLQCLHGGSVIHGDLKPGNILMTRFPSSLDDLNEDCIKLSDFGLSSPLPKRRPGLQGVPRLGRPRGGTPDVRRPQGGSGPRIGRVGPWRNPVLHVLLQPRPIAARESSSARKHNGMACDAGHQVLGVSDAPGRRRL